MFTGSYDNGDVSYSLMSLCFACMGQIVVDVSGEDEESDFILKQYLLLHKKVDPLWSGQHCDMVQATTHASAPSIQLCVCHLSHPSARSFLFQHGTSGCSR
ncbi:hypothetical protein ANN_05183 [Periplaneta americana]|uniref:Uncharacterized protein n=1 Tax=Periplaneta americana TaxID=6978 RepID=A0ABQ8TBP5_PERAM|nr:hypothetical protein ANN_05183 [Periplaneta americana]